jgi:small-conductance mechanosensitive channel
MNEDSVANLLQNPGDIRVLRIVIILAVAWLLANLISRLIPWLATRIKGRIRVYLLPSVPVLRLFVLITALVSVVPLIVEPTLQNLATILAAVGVALGFAFKDYVSSIIAGIVAVYERPYRTGDWVKIDDAYGEIRSMGLRALEIVTPDDTVVSIPHAKLWDSNIHNDTDGGTTLLCVANFYLQPNNDAARIREALGDVALTSPFLSLERPVVVVLSEKPWGTHYRLKAYPIDGRDQFQFVSDLTVRGQIVLAALGAEPVVTAPAVASELGT